MEVLINYFMNRNHIIFPQCLKSLRRSLNTPHLFDFIKRFALLSMYSVYREKLKQKQTDRFMSKVKLNQRNTPQLATKRLMLSLPTPNCDPFGTLWQVFWAMFLELIHKFLRFIKRSEVNNLRKYLMQLNPILRL